MFYLGKKDFLKSCPDLVKLTDDDINKYIDSCYKKSNKRYVDVNDFFMRECDKYIPNDVRIAIANAMIPGANFSFGQIAEFLKYNPFIFGYFLKANDSVGYGIEVTEDEKEYIANWIMIYTADVLCIENPWNIEESFSHNSNSNNVKLTEEVTAIRGYITSALNIESQEAYSSLIHALYRTHDLNTMCSDITNAQLSYRYNNLYGGQSNWIWNQFMFKRFIPYKFIRGLTNILQCEGVGIDNSQESVLLLYLAIEMNMYNTEYFNPVIWRDNLLRKSFVIPEGLVESTSLDEVITYMVRNGDADKIGSAFNIFIVNTVNEAVESNTVCGLIAKLIRSLGMETSLEEVPNKYDWVDRIGTGRKLQIIYFLLESFDIGETTDSDSFFHMVNHLRNPIYSVRFDEFEGSHCIYFDSSKLNIKFDSNLWKMKCMASGVSIKDYSEAMHFPIPQQLESLWSELTTIKPGDRIAVTIKLLEGCYKLVGKFRPSLQLARNKYFIIGNRVMCLHSIPSLHYLLSTNVNSNGKVCGESSTIHERRKVLKDINAIVACDYTAGTIRKQHELVEEKYVTISSMVRLGNMLCDAMREYLHYGYYYAFKDVAAFDFKYDYDLLVTSLNGILNIPSENVPTAVFETFTPEVINMFLQRVSNEMQIKQVDKGPKHSSLIIKNLVKNAILNNKEVEVPSAPRMSNMSALKAAAGPRPTTPTPGSLRPTTPKTPGSVRSSGLDTTPTTPSIMRNAFNQEPDNSPKPIG